MENKESIEGDSEDPLLNPHREIVDLDLHLSGLQRVQEESVDVCIYGQVICFCVFVFFSMRGAVNQKLEVEERYTPPVMGL